MFKIDREEARRISDDYLRQQERTEYSVENVLTLIEIQFRRPCIYGLSLNDSHWIAYLRGPSTGLMHKSSDVIVISRKDGSVLHFGSAGDEG